MLPFVLHREILLTSGPSFLKNLFLHYFQLEQVFQVPTLFRASRLQGSTSLDWSGLIHLVVFIGPLSMHHFLIQWSDMLLPWPQVPAAILN